MAEAKPYGEDLIVQKLECIGHVQKRMGSRLRKLKFSGAKLPDGKPLGGKRRLTDVAIDNIQKFYGDQEECGRRFPNEKSYLGRIFSFGIK